MRKLFIVFASFFFLSSMDAKLIRKSHKSLIEIGPKVNLYIGEEVAFGLGAEIVVNPINGFGIRTNFTEIIFDGGTSFYLNTGDHSFSNLSFDGFFYIPMPNVEPYIHGGFGFTISNAGTPAVTKSFFTFRAGMGFNFSAAPGANLFVEPGIIIIANDDTEATFRLSFGARFGILR